MCSLHSDHLMVWSVNIKVLTFIFLKTYVIQSSKNVILCYRCSMREKYVIYIQSVLWLGSSKIKFICSRYMVIGRDGRGDWWHFRYIFKTYRHPSNTSQINIVWFWRQVKRQIIHSLLFKRSKHKFKIASAGSFNWYFFLLHNITQYCIILRKKRFLFSLIA